MNREVHVRFWESPEVKVLRATRHQQPPTFVPGGDRCSPESGRQGGRLCSAPPLAWVV